MTHLLVILVLDRDSKNSWFLLSLDPSCTTVPCVFIITDKANLVGEEVKGVGVMKDEELQFEEIEVSHTLVCLL
jgi:hypothetical protein